MLVILASLVLTACAGPSAQSSRSNPPPEVVARYQPVVDGDITIPAVNPGYLIERNVRTEVAYTGPEEPGSIVVDPFARVLYYVMPEGRAMRYGIAVGRQGYGFRGDATISLKREWPNWTPTKNMIRREPEIYGPVAAGLPGGLENPLGARALYLYRNGRDTYYRIHGTNNASTIGRATSAGCIRLFNQDILDLYGRVDRNAQVTVRSLSQSIAQEGEMVEDAQGYMVPMASLPEDVQAAIRAGETPWPKFTALAGVAPESETEAAATDDPQDGV